jgi:hypothetical protein
VSSVYYKCTFMDATIEYQAFTSKLPLKNCRNLLVGVKVGLMQCSLSGGDFFV